MAVKATPLADGTGVVLTLWDGSMDDPRAQSIIVEYDEIQSVVAKLQDALWSHHAPKWRAEDE